MSNQGFQKSKQSGFSLIELLVVVAIIGILASAGVVGYTKYIDGVKKDTHKNNAASMAQALTNIATLKSGSLTVQETGCTGTGTGASDITNCAQNISLNNKWVSPLSAAVTGTAYVTSGTCATGLLQISGVSGTSGQVSDCNGNNFNFTAW